jgi:hypothetical protein
MDHVTPVGDPKALPGGDYVPEGEEAATQQWRTLGRNVGEQVCQEIAEHPERLGPWGCAVKDWLGPDAIERIRAKVAAFYGAH